MRLLVFIAALVGLAVLGIKGLSSAAPELEKRLEDKVVLNLAEEGNAWAEASVDGRDVHLSGSANSVSMAERAISAVKHLWGVRNVTSNIQIEDQPQISKIAQKPYRLTVEKTPNLVKITGSVESQESKDLLERIAKTNYGSEFVESELAIQSGAPAGWRSAAGSIIFNIGQFESAKAELTEKGLTVHGETVEQSFGEFAQNKMTQALPEGYVTVFNISVMNIEPAAGPSEGSGSFVNKLFSSNKVDFCKNLTELSKTDVKFAFDSSIIREADKPHLNEIAIALASCEKDDLVIHGHTDSIGTTLYNQWLSEQRALAGKRYLMTKGISKDRISTLGHSENEPIATNATEEGRFKNRRIEFKPQTNN